MTALRRFLFDRRLLAATIVAFAMMLKVAVPAGFMVGSQHGTITIELCSGTGPMTMTMAIPGMEHRQSGHDTQGKEMPCAFSAMAAPSLAATDPLLLALAIAFIVAITFRVEPHGIARAPAYLRPPLRGPPRRA